MRFVASLGAITLALGLVLSSIVASGAEASTGGIWISDAELDRLPTSGEAWYDLATTASATPIAGNPTLIDQDSMHSRNTMAAALYAARVDSASVRVKVRDAIRWVKGTESGSELASNRLLQLGRNLPGYVIAADLIDLKSFDPTFDAQFRAWISSLRTTVFSGTFRTIANADEHDPANWGAYDGAARAAIAAYLGDAADLARSAAALKSFTGEVNDGRWDFRPDVHDMSWQCTYPDESGYRAINAPCSRDSHDLNGFMAQDMARAGGYQWPPIMTHYVRENLNGRVIQAEILRRAGYPNVYDWGNKAFLRVAQGLRRLDQFDADWFEPDALVHRIIATRHTLTGWGLSSAARGRGVAGVDWTHRPGASQDIPLPTAPVEPSAAPTATVAPTPTPAPQPTPSPTLTPLTPWATAVPPTSAPTATPPPTPPPTSTPSPTVAPTAAPEPGGDQRIIPASDDAKVLASAPDRNYRASNLQVRNDDRRSYIRFDVSGTQGRQISGAVLRLYVTDPSRSSGTAYQTASDWSEATLTWNTRPAENGPALGRGGAAGMGDYITYDVTAAIRGDGAVSFVLRDGPNDSVLFASTETDDSHRPELEITLAP